MDGAEIDDRERWLVSIGARERDNWGMNNA